MSGPRHVHRIASHRIASCLRRATSGIIRNRKNRIAPRSSFAKRFTLPRYFTFIRDSGINQPPVFSFTTSRRGLPNALKQEPSRKFMGHLAASFLLLDQRTFQLHFGTGRRSRLTRSTQHDSIERDTLNGTHGIFSRFIESRWVALFRI